MMQKWLFSMIVAESLKHAPTALKHAELADISSVVFQRQATNR